MIFAYDNRPRGRHHGRAVDTRDLTASPPVSGVVDTFNATAVGTVDLTKR